MMRGNLLTRQTDTRRLFEIALGVSLLLHIALFQGFRTFEAKGQRLTIFKPGPPVILQVPPTQINKPKAAPARPSIPIPSDKDEIPDYITIDPDEWLLEVNEKAPAPPDDIIVPFHECSEHPEPIGGYGAIAAHLVYPELAKRANVEGRVTVEALIGKKGDVLETRILQSLGPNGCDEAAMNAVRQVKWTPAMQRDMPVKVWVAIPVDFRLTAK